MEEKRFEWIDVDGGRRPVALIDFEDVLKGTVGGLFKDTSDMQQKGTCWVDESCVVHGETTIGGDVRIEEETVVSNSDICCSGVIRHSKLYSVIATKTVKVVSSNISRSNISECEIEHSYVKLSKLLREVTVTDSSVYLCRMEGPFVSVRKNSVVKCVTAYRDITIQNSIIGTKSKRLEETGSVLSENVYLKNVIIERGADIASNSNLVDTKILGAHVVINKTEIKGDVSIFDNISIEESVIEPAGKNSIRIGVSKRMYSGIEIPIRGAHIKKQDDLAIFQIGKSCFVSCFRNSKNDIQFFYRFSKTNRSDDAFDVKEFFVKELPFSFREETEEEKPFNSFFEMILWGAKSEIVENISEQTENLLDVFMDELDDGFNINFETVKKLIYFSMLECTFKTANFLCFEKPVAEIKDSIWKGGRILTDKCTKALFKYFEINIFKKETTIPTTTFITRDALRMIAGDLYSETLIKNSVEKITLIR